MLTEFIFECRQSPFILLATDLQKQKQNYTYDLIYQPEHRLPDGSFRFCAIFQREYGRSFLLRLDLCFWISNLLYIGLVIYLKINIFV
jgi:hypothetical protein